MSIDAGVISTGVVGACIIGLGGAGGAGGAGAIGLGGAGAVCAGSTGLDGIGVGGALLTPLRPPRPRPLPRPPALLTWPGADADAGELFKAAGAGLPCEKLGRSGGEGCGGATSVGTSQSASQSSSCVVTSWRSLRRTLLIRTGAPAPSI